MCQELLLFLYKNSHRISPSTIPKLITPLSAMSGTLKNLSLSPRIFSLTLLLSINFFSCYSLNQQGQALLAWKNSSNSTVDALASWNPLNTSPCNWFGVHCNSQGEVVEINLKSVNLQGSSLPSNFQPLRSLKVLVLSSTNITGRIPKEIGNYEELMVIDVSDNSLLGEIPEEICRLRKLQSLAVHENFLEGNIPPNIGNLSSLMNLTLYDNKLSGEIPKSIGSLSKLQVFRAGGNANLKGEIPWSIGNCTNLVMLGLAETRISGSLPSSIGMLKRIQTIAMYTTLLSGSIPEEIGNCSELQNLYLHQNSISGSIPSRIGALSKLQNLLLWQNNIVGTIPEDLGRCSELQVIDLSENLLTGSIPRSFGKLSNLQGLQLSVNQLSGVIPPEISNCTSLSQLEIDNNAISGDIPPVIGNLRSLTLFFAWKNKLRGKIPDSLSLCQDLQALDLSYNHLIGPIPKQLFGLKSLTKLLLLSNDLSGYIPPDVGNCTSLYRLRLNQNRLAGNIPSEITNLKNLNFLDMSSNHLVGEIPPTLSRCHNLEFLNLSCNQFSGKIPPQFSGLFKLGVFDLSHNKLSGSLDALSGLQNLVSLNVSFNDFSGEMPNTPFFRKLPLSDLIANKDLYIPGGVVTPADKMGVKVHTRLAMTLKIVMSILLVISAVLVLLTIHVLVHAHFANKALMGSNSRVMNLYQKFEFSIDNIVQNLTSANVIGTGRSGVVYKVTSPKGQTLAVKRMWSSAESGAFSSEIQRLGSIRHDNIIKLLGWASNKNLKLLFYEYLPNGSLSSLLHGSGKGKAEWETRYEIVLGLAQALVYLHHDCVPSISHGDVKSMNVLLGSGSHPYLVGFGLSRIASENGDGTNFKPVQRPCLAGSYAYMAPEHASMQKITEKSDVYSFGVVLLEVLTGRHPLEPTLPGGSHLVQWVRNHLASKRDPCDILDPKLRGRTGPTMHEILQTLAVSFLCVSAQAEDRPTMKDIVAMLKEIRPVEASKTDPDVRKGF
ncbi:LRR receptor-like serine/threonine-protein kinase RGI3 [Lotus japonicus]|uniref:LRR receptor-like serine/threonine-protein kinase RGI3 n=1 Tax=Lotus japonicus TaxID=34305 RepID=UPI0025867995|nr:LRR receptor-like serine/threonine-protein kinase RGI3 [Lotus japonicus]